MATFSQGTELFVFAPVSIARTSWPAFSCLPNRLAHLQCSHVILRTSLQLSITQPVTWEADTCKLCFTNSEPRFLFASLRHAGKDGKDRGFFSSVEACHEHTKVGPCEFDEHAHSMLDASAKGSKRRHAEGLESTLRGIRMHRTETCIHVRHVASWTNCVLDFCRRLKQGTVSRSAGPNRWSWHVANKASTWSA